MFDQHWINDIKLSVWLISWKRNYIDTSWCVCVHVCTWRSPDKEDGVVQTSSKRNHNVASMTRWKKGTLANWHHPAFTTCDHLSYRILLKRRFQMFDFAEHRIISHIDTNHTSWWPKRLTSTNIHTSLVCEILLHGFKWEQKQWAIQVWPFYWREELLECSR